MSGVKHDLGKTRYELLPPEFLEGVAVILTFGAEKYAARNWEQGIAYSRAYGALQRHLWAWWGGEDLDVESGKSHLWHAGCELAFLITFEARGMEQLDDRAKTGNNIPPLRREVPAEALAPRKNVQPLSGRDGGQLVQRPWLGPVGRVEVGERQTQPQASALDQRAREGGA